MLNPLFILKKIRGRPYLPLHTLISAVAVRRTQTIERLLEVLMAIPNVIVVATKNGNYTTVTDAVAYVASDACTPTEEEGYLILVCPGEYDCGEGFEIPDYTAVKGLNEEQVRLLLDDEGTITVAEHGDILDLLLGDGTETFTYTEDDEDGSYTITKVTD